MKPGDIQRIESALSIQLPPAYAQAMAPFPIPAYVSNTETLFWDDADELIKLNLTLRQKEGSRHPWPTRFYALGRDDGGCSDAIDLDDPEFGVFWFDRQHIDVTTDQRSEEKIQQWILRQVKELTSDLMADGINPDGTPAERDANTTQNSIASCSSCVVLAIVVLVIVLIVAFISRH